MFLMAKTINFCGDSFCANESDASWIAQLASKLEARVLGTGNDGTAHEHSIKSFDPQADVTIFCWTEASRIYHPTHPLNLSSCTLYCTKDQIYEAGLQFYQHIHDLAYFRTRQMRDLYWFDHEILSQYKGIAISLWSFDKTYQFTNAHNFALPPLKSLSNRAQGKINHMNESMNQLLAKKLNNFIRSLHG